MTATDTPACPSWCVGGHGPRYAHTSPPANTFDVITQLRMHHGNATTSIVLDAPRNTGVTLDIDELDRVIATLNTCRDRLARAVQKETR